MDEIPSFNFVIGDLAGKKNGIISHTGYTGAGGFEIYFDNSDGPAILSALMDAGREYDIQPAGLASRDTLRLEMGLCLYGNDIDDSTSPLEAGLGWITKFVDGNDFIDRKNLEVQKEMGLRKKLVGFELNERGYQEKTIQS